MLRPESPLADHRSLLPRRLLPVKAQIAPADKRKNRRSLELNPPTDYEYPKLLISKTTDSLNTAKKQESADSLKRLLKDDKKKVVKQDSTESLKKAFLSRQDSNDSKKEPKRPKQDVKPEVKRGSDKKALLETDNFEETCKRLYERRTGAARPTLPPVAEKGLESPESPNRSPLTPGVAAIAEGVVRWGSGLLSPKEEPRLRTARSWYGYGTLPTDSEKLGAGATGPGARALELILSGGLKSLARPARPVRRAASRDSVLSQPQPLLEGLRKCSTVLALTDREKVTEPIRAHNRLRAPSVCSRCSSLLSLAGAGSRYSLDGAGGGFVPAAPVNCKLCLEDAAPDKVTVIGGCGCAYCTKCMKAYVEFEVCNGAYEVSCPDARCRVGAALALEEISLLVDASVMEKHLKFRLNHEVAMDANRAFCPRVGCDTVVSLRAASPAHCPTCRHDFCSQCNQEWHGSMSCEAAAASSSMAGAGAPLLPDSELIKLCPMCRVPIEKDEGCAQMMCKRCKHVFCWYCLASLDDDFLLRHYDKGPCKNKLGHSRASVLWHRAQVVGIFAGFGLLLLVASPLLLLAAPCIVCCKCRLCNPSTKNLEEVDEIESISPGREGDEEITRARYLSD
ncbi:E3 ubiquitin-protein ligase lubel isoform X1 [Cydia amplana]|uniref:E3 ubiquitin-protein ligase lubel isoform X1 n=1 Tax=Cydia amplana TaxID=1869771 RepID=UPI002FE639D3